MQKPNRKLLANTKLYDVFGAFANKETFWPISSKVMVGDTIYIYLSAPYKQIGFVCETLEIDIEKDKVIEKVRPFIIAPGKKENSRKKLFMKLRVNSKVALKIDSSVSYSLLKENGLTGMLMGPRKLENNPTLLDYIQRRLS
jgi:hypothetical protein